MASSGKPASSGVPPRIPPKTSPTHWPTTSGKLPKRIAILALPAIPPEGRLIFGSLKNAPSIVPGDSGLSPRKPLPDSAHVHLPIGFQTGGVYSGRISL